MRRKRARARHTLRVNTDARPIDTCRDVARQFAPGLTDDEIVQGLRDLADQIEADSATKHARAVI